MKRLLFTFLIAALFCTLARGQSVAPFLLTSVPAGGGGGTLTYVQTVGSAAGSYVTTRDVSITFGSASGTLAVLATSWSDAEGAYTVTSVQIVSNSQNFTKFIDANWATYQRGSLWYCASPPSGAQTVRVTYSGNVYVRAAVVEFSGASATQDRTPASDADGNVTVSSATGDIVVGLCGSDFNTAPTPDAGQTSRLSASSPGYNISTKAGASSVTMTWTGAFAGCAAVSIKPGS